MRREIIERIVRSWAATDSTVTPTAEILDWIDQRNRQTHVDIRKVSMAEMSGWYYDREEGVLRNPAGSFFKISGFRGYAFGEKVTEQPIILQPENGFLGIICKEIDGVLHFLMQAKIEPGNLNQIQISPTIQATKSNFTQAHGGRKPDYLDWFSHADRYEIILDQLQSEQSARFLKKRNRNLMILVEDEVPQLPTHRWMTLGQIKDLMCRYDNLVNMDTRTVLSGIPFSELPGPEAEELRGLFREPALFRSIFCGNGDYALPKVYNCINNYKMFAEREYSLLPLHALEGWRFAEDGVFPEQGGGFRVVYCQIEIEGREVRRWTQPLFEALEISTFGLICCDIDGVRHFLVQTLAEPGCFDGIELGPTLQIDTAIRRAQNERFLALLNDPRSRVLCDVLLSEEGGRFYHEQNRNRVVLVDRAALGELPEGYFLLDYRTLNRMCQINNCLNIQLRNLLALLRITE